MERNNKGQFIETTCSTRYKKVQYKGVAMNMHQRVICQALGIKKIPKGLIIHHIDENTSNNDIDNLALITYTAHNRIHSHSPWNKDLTIKTSKKWAKTIDKATETRLKNKLPIFKKTFELQLEGKRLWEIALIQGISRRQVSGRIKRYKEYIKFNN